MTDVTFATASGSRGRVHVLNPDAGVRVHFPGPDGEMQPFEALARCPIGRTYCGLDLDQARHGVATGGGTLWEFDDERLCVSCVRAYPGDSVELFRHPTPEVLR